LSIFHFSPAAAAADDDDVPQLVGAFDEAAKINATVD
jgi:hypothetical protein